MEDDSFYIAANAEEREFKKQHGIRAFRELKAEQHRKLQTEVPKMGINKKHPELREGEILLTNSNETDYESIGWNVGGTKKLESLRKGRIAYDSKGEIVKDFFPVFVNRNRYAIEQKKWHAFLEEGT